MASYTSGVGFKMVCHIIGWHELTNSCTTQMLLLAHESFQPLAWGNIQCAGALPQKVKLDVQGNRLGFLHPLGEGLSDEPIIPSCIMRDVMNEV